MGRKVNVWGAAWQHPKNVRTELETISRRSFIQKHRIQTLGILLTLSSPQHQGGNFCDKLVVLGKALELQYSELVPSKS